MIKLDYNLKTPEERVAFINEHLDEIENNSYYLTYLANYILCVNDRNQTKTERSQQHPVITKNREKTINKRQVSFEELLATFENEDSVYLMISNNKNQILDPKDTISLDDTTEDPEILQYLEIIKQLQKQLLTSPNKFAIKKQIIETWQQIYLVRAMSQSTTKPTPQLRNMTHIPLPENITLDTNLMPQSDCLISLFNPIHISFLLCYYSQLKEDCYDDLNSDMHWLLIDLEELAHRTLRNDPFLYALLVYKIDGLTNEQIQEQMEINFDRKHSEQYYSTLWRKRIPKLIAERAKKEWLEWHYTNKVRGEWIKCGRCGQYKLAHPMFFSTNTNSTGYYSICKECRSKKGGVNAS